MFTLDYKIIMSNQVVIIYNDEYDNITVKDETDILTQLNQLKNENQLLKKQLEENSQQLKLLSTELDKCRQIIENYQVESQKFKQNQDHINHLESELKISIQENNHKSITIDKMIHDSELCRSEIKKKKKMYALNL